MAARRGSAQEQHRKAVASYVAAGGEVSVQLVITALYGVTKKLDHWYTRQCADLGLTQGEWAVLAALAKAHDSQITPSRLAELTSVAPSSMTHRLDKMAARGLVKRTPDKTNRTRILVSLIEDGQASGEFRKDVDALVASRLMFAGLLVQSVWQQHGEQVPELAVDADRTVESAVEFFLHGLRP